MSDQFVTVHIFCKDIPASGSKPFKLLISKQVIFETTDSLDSDYVVIDADIPEPKFTGSASFYLQTVIGDNIDDLRQFKVENGNHIEIKLDKKGGLVFTQRHNDKFDEPYQSKKIETKQLEEKFDYSSTALDPKLNVTKTIKTKEVETPAAVWIYLQNITASYDKPTQLYVDKKLQLTMQKSQPLNKCEILKVDLSSPKDKVDIRLNIRIEGYDINQEFDLKANGEHIQFGMVDDNIRIAQRSDGKFAPLPTQKPRPKEEEEEQTQSSSSGSSKDDNSSYSDVTIYCVNCNASSVKKFILKVNGNIIQKVEKAIPSGQVMVVKGQFAKPKSGDHKITVSALLPACGFYEPLEEDFNLTKHGKYIKLEVVEESNNSVKCDFAQQHEPFFGKETQVVKEEPKKISVVPQMKKQEEPTKVEAPKKVETKVEVKKEEPKPTTTQKSSELNQLEQLEALADLLQRGILTKQEFDFKKKKILGL